MSSVTSSHFTSSSSAMICASAVPTCCPISALRTCTVVLPSGVIVNQIEGVNASMPSAAPAGATVPSSPGPKAIPSIAPAPVVAERTRNSRRVRPRAAAPSAVVILRVVSAIPHALPHDLGRALDCADDARVGRASAQIAVHGAHDLFLGRVRGAGEERRSLHDLTRLTVPALGHLVLDPCLLDRVAVPGVQALDRRDQGALDLPCGDLTGPDCLAVDVHGAGA